MLRWGPVLALMWPLAATPAVAAPPAPPTLTVPAGVTVEPENRFGATVGFEVSGTDWKGRAAPVTCEPDSDSLFPLGVTQVSCTATDLQEQSTDDSFPVSVEYLHRPAERATLARFQRVRFAWYPVLGAQLYNLQLWRKVPNGWKKVASVFPSDEDFLLARSWTHQGQRFRLVRGSYRWYAWPWLENRYGQVLGRNKFVVRYREPTTS